jgi:hypothetical protein
LHGTLATTSQLYEIYVSGSDSPSIWWTYLRRQ